MVLTKHARIRMKERCGLPKKAVEKSAAIALRNGISHSETTGRLKKYMDYLFLSHGYGGNMKLYNNYIYIFTTSDKLITVLPLPNIYKNAVSKISKRQMNSD